MVGVVALLAVGGVSAAAGRTPCAPANDVGGGPVLRATMSVRSCPRGASEWVLASAADLRPQHPLAARAPAVVTAPPAAPAPQTVVHAAPRRPPPAIQQIERHVIRPHGALGRAYTAALPFVQPAESSTQRVRGLVTVLLACALLFLGAGALPRRMVPSGRVEAMLVVRRVHLTTIGSAFLAVAGGLIVLAALGH